MQNSYNTLKREFSECLARLVIIKLNFNSRFPKAFWKSLWKLFLIWCKRKCFTHWLTWRKKHIEKTRRAWFLLGNHRKQDFRTFNIWYSDILEICEVLKFCLKFSKFINIKQYAHFLLTASLKVFTTYIISTRWYCSSTIYFERYDILTGKCLKIYPSE